MLDGQRVVGEPAELNGHRAATLQDHVHSDAMKPRPEGGFSPERRELLPGAHEHILNQLVCARAARHAPDQGRHAPDMGTIQAFERPRVALRGQRGIRRDGVRVRALDFSAQNYCSRAHRSSWRLDGLRPLEG